MGEGRGRMGGRGGGVVHSRKQIKPTHTQPCQPPPRAWRWCGLGVVICQGGVGGRGGVARVVCAARCRPRPAGQRRDRPHRRPVPYPATHTHTPSLMFYHCLLPHTRPHHTHAHTQHTHTHTTPHMPCLQCILYRFSKHPCNAPCAPPPPTLPPPTPPPTPRRRTRPFRRFGAAPRSAVPGGTGGPGTTRRRGGGPGGVWGAGGVGGEGEEEGEGEVRVDGRRCLHGYLFSPGPRSPTQAPPLPLSPFLSTPHSPARSLAVRAPPPPSPSLPLSHPHTGGRRHQGAHGQQRPHLLRRGGGGRVLPVRGGGRGGVEVGGEVGRGERG